MLYRHFKQGERLNTLTHEQQIILVDDEKHLRQACTQSLELAGLSVKSFPSAEGVVDELGCDWDGIVISDIRMPGKDGLSLMKDILALDSDIPVILISGHGDVPMAVQAMRDGAYDFIEKPFPSEMMVDAARRALEKRRLRIENRRLKAALNIKPPLDQILLGSSDVIVAIRKQIMDLCDVNVDVLISGETGVGKDLIARSLHGQSQSRSVYRFVAINCGSLPENIIESELFGHVAGAFQGASTDRVGKFEHADGGTLFLDEVESMPVALQIKLLQVLQDRLVVRLGTNLEIPVDVRVVAASKVDLLEAVNQGKFREDLYYRLNVLSLKVPELKARRDDIPFLFQHFVTSAGERYNREPRVVSNDCLSRLLLHDWPGNVRELQNVATAYVLGSPNALLDELEGELLAQQVTLADKVSAFEKQVIEQAISQQGGSLKATYELLGVSRKTLYDKIQKHGIQMSSS